MVSKFEILSLLVTSLNLLFSRWKKMRHRATCSMYVRGREREDRRTCADHLRVGACEIPIAVQAAEKRRHLPLDRQSQSRISISGLACHNNDPRGISADLRVRLRILNARYGGRAGFPWRRRSSLRTRRGAVRSLGRGVDIVSASRSCARPPSAGAAHGSLFRRRSA